MSVCSPEVRRWKNKERDAEKEKPGAVNTWSHTPASFTHPRTLTSAGTQTSCSFGPAACGHFFFPSLSAKWSLCPHENLWHLIPAEKWAGRRFDHKSASSHSSQSASALRGTEFVLFNLAWGNAGAIGIDLVRHMCCFVSVDGCKVTLFSLWGKGLQAF